MRPTIDNLLKSLETQPSESLEQRMNDLFASQPVMRLGIWRRIVQSPIARFAMAAVFIAGVFVLASYLRGDHGVTPPPNAPVAHETQPLDSNQTTALTQLQPVQTELEQARVFFEQADTDGLLALLETGGNLTQITVARYLGQLGDEKAIPPLQTFAEQWQGSETGNPFQTAIERIEQQGQSNPPPLDPNQPNAKTTPPIDGSSEPKAETIITGMVLDADGLRPISGATVSCMTGNRTTTDAQGQFTLSVKRDHPGGARVRALASGYATQRVNVSVGKGMTQRLDFKLGPGFKVVGTVRDIHDQPIKAATIRVSGMGFGVGGIYTGADGRFIVEGLNPNEESYRLYAEHPGYVESFVHLPPTSAGQICNRDIVLAQGITLFGQVTDWQGKPISGVQVGRNRFAQAKTISDTNGRYSLKNVPRDERFLWAAHEEHGLLVQSVYLSGDASEFRIDLLLDKPHPLHGQVLDQAGDPVPGVSVGIHAYGGVSHLWRKRRLSDSQGNFVIPNAPKQGALTLSVYKEDIASETYEINLGEQGCTLTVSYVGCIYGKVVDNATDEPIRRFIVKLRSEQGGYPASWADGLRISSDQGFFGTDGAKLALYRDFSVTVIADGYKHLDVLPVKVQPTSSDPNRVLFRLERASVMAGRVVDKQGRPISGAKIAVFSRANLDTRSDWLQVVTDEVGLFTLSGMDPEQHCLHVTAEGFVAFAGLLEELVIGQLQLKDIVLDVGAHIWGQVFDDQGQPVEDAMVTAHDNSAIADRRSMREALNGRMPGLAPRTRTNQDGYYELHDVSIGRVGVQVMTPKRNQRLAYENIITNPEDSIELNFGNEVGFTVEGIVRVLIVPLEGANVRLDTKEGIRRSKSAQTDSSGKFSISGLSPGSYQLGVQSRPQPGSSAREKRHLYVLLDVHQDLSLDIEMEEKTVLEVGSCSVRGRIPLSLRTQADATQIRATRSIDIGPNSKEGGYPWENVPAEFKVRPDGTFVGEQLGPGIYRLVLSRDQRIVAISDAIVLSEGENLSDVGFTMGAGEVSIRVIDAATGQGIPNASFQLINDMGISFRAQEFVPEEKHAMHVDSQGQCLIDRLPEGHYHTKATASGYLLNESQDGIVQMGSLTPLVVSLNPAASVDFEISDTLLQDVSGNYILVDCRITETDTQRVLQNKNLYTTSDRHTYGMRLTGQGDWASHNPIALPEGHYTIAYTVHSMTIKDKSQAGPSKKLAQGETTVTCLQNQTTTISIFE